MKTLVVALLCLGFGSAVYAQRLTGPATPAMVSASRTAAAGEQGKGGALDWVAGQHLVRNGAGYRMKGATRVSQIEVYAAQRFSSLEELNQMAGNKRVVISLLSDAPSNFMGKGLTRGIEDNTPKSELSTLVPMLIRLGEVFNQHKTLGAGSKVLIDWVQGQGMVLSINGEPQGEPFQDMALFRAMMGIWLGPVPVDSALKNELLGGGAGRADAATTK